MKRGDLVVISPGAHGYPDEWKRGEDPTSFQGGGWGIFLDKFEESISSPRTFYRLVTPFGTVSMNSVFCRGV